MDVFVFGATGKVGGLLAQELIHQGDGVRGLVRGDARRAGLGEARRRGRQHLDRRGDAASAHLGNAVGTAPAGRSCGAS